LSQFPRQFPFISRLISGILRGSDLSASKGGLGDMFKTPDALTFKGTFEEARAEAESQGKLLMVNIQVRLDHPAQKIFIVFRRGVSQFLLTFPHCFAQDDQEFASHMLNRCASFRSFCAVFSPALFASFPLFRSLSSLFPRVPPVFAVCFGHTLNLV
jgi:hypothetical protein